MQVERVVGGYLDLPLPQRKASGAKDLACLSDIILYQVGVLTPRNDTEE